MTRYGASQPVRRVEDARFVTGHGRYMDDINLAGQAYGFMLRSSVAHATIRAIDTAANDQIAHVAVAVDLQCRHSRFAAALHPHADSRHSRASAIVRAELAMTRLAG